MGRRLLDVDPVTGVTTYHDYDESTDTTIITTEQDIGAILEENKRRQNDGDGYSPSKDLRYVGEIPITLIAKWRTELGIDVFDRNCWPAVKRLLNSNEYRHLRTALWTV